MGNELTVRVKVFARLREACGGQSSVELVLGEDARASDCFAALCERHPRAAALREGLAVAVNDEYAAWDDEVADGDEVAFIPPVSGGAIDIYGGGS